MNTSIGRRYVVFLAAVLLLAVTFSADRVVQAKGHGKGAGYGKRQWSRLCRMHAWERAHETAAHTGQAVVTPRAATRKAQKREETSVIIWGWGVHGFNWGGWRLGSVILPIPQEERHRQRAREAQESLTAAVVSMADAQRSALEMLQQTRATPAASNRPAVA